MVKKENKICLVCKLIIDLKKEHYVEIKEFNEGEYIDSAFWHKNCYMGFVQSKYKSNQIMDKANRLLESVGVRL